MILKEKRFADFFGVIEVPKKIKNVQKILKKNTIQENCTKKVQFCNRRRKSQGIVDVFLRVSLIVVWHDRFTNGTLESFSQQEYTRYLLFLL